MRPRGDLTPGRGLADGVYLKPPQAALHTTPIHGARNLPRSRIDAFEHDASRSLVEFPPRIAIVG